MREETSPGEPSARVCGDAARAQGSVRSAQKASLADAVAQGEGARAAVAMQDAVAPPSDADGARSGRIGFLEGIGCHVVWGLMPVYWKLLSAVPALEVLSWRMVWSCVFVVLLCVFVKRTRLDRKSVV